MNSSERRWTAQAWFQDDGKHYTVGDNNLPLHLTTSNQRAAHNFRARLIENANAAGVPDTAEAAWVSPLRCEQRTAEGRWFAMDERDGEGGVCLFDHRPSPPVTDVDWQAMVKAHLAGSTTVKGTT
jgi:hypothetical protein